MKVIQAFQMAATGWRLGKVPFGGIIGSLAALPICFLLATMPRVNALAAIGTVLVLIGVSVAVSHVALSGAKAPAAKHLVLDKVCGVLLALLFIPFRIKIVVFGWVLFHLMSFMSNLVELRGMLGRLAHQKGVIGVFFDDLLIGLAVNVFLHVMIWIVH